MIFVWISLAFILGAIAALVFVTWSLQRAVRRANICADDRRFVKDILGIPQ